MKQLQDRLVGNQTLQVRGFLLALPDLHQMCVAVPEGELNKAQPVAGRIKTHRFAIDGDGRTKGQIVGKIILVEVIGHESPFFQVHGTSK